MPQIKCFLYFLLPNYSTYVFCSGFSSEKKKKKGFKYLNLWVEFMKPQLVPMFSMYLAYVQC